MTVESMTWRGIRDAAEMKTEGSTNLAELREELSHSFACNTSGKTANEEFGCFLMLEAWDGTLWVNLQADKCAKEKGTKLKLTTLPSSTCSWFITALTLAGSYSWIRNKLVLRGRTNIEGQESETA